MVTVFVMKHIETKIHVMFVLVGSFVKKIIIQRHVNGLVNISVIWYVSLLLVHHNERILD